MNSDVGLAHKFVEYIPEELEEHVLYVSMTFATAVHKCCCGCGKEVVTPLSPTDWRITFDGESVSLYPSIGNWSLECQSHYWIEHGQVRWARPWSRAEIEVGRARDASAKRAAFEASPTLVANSPVDTADEPHAPGRPVESIWQRLRSLIFR